MVTVVIPFAGAEGKTRLHDSSRVRRALAHAMFCDVLAPLYGPSSSDRFREHAASLGLEAVSVALPNLADDVDTMEDLTRLQLRAGPRTQACLAELERSVV